MSESQQTCQIISQQNNLDKFFDYCLKIFLVVGTLFYLPLPKGVSPFEAAEFGYMTQELFFRYGVIFLFAITLGISPKRNLKLISGMALLCFLVIISIFISFNVQARSQILNIFMGLLFYKIIVENIDLKKLKEYSFWLFMLLVSNLVLCAFQYFGHDPIFRHVNADIVPGIEKTVGFMRLRASLGVLTAMISPFLALISPWLCVIALPLIYIGKASSAAIAFLVSMGFISFFRVPKKWFIGIVALVIACSLGYIFFCDTADGDKRFLVWFTAISHALKSSPFIGFGIGKFAVWMPQTDQIGTSDKLTWLWAHNEFIQSFFEMGIAGLVIVLAFVRGRIEGFWKFRNDRTIQVLFASVISVFIVSFFHFPFHLAKLVGIALFLIAIFHAKVIENETV